MWVNAPCDNTLQVGGEFFETALFAMNEFGRVSVCGSISSYNVEDPPKGIVICSQDLMFQVICSSFPNSKADTWSLGGQCSSQNLLKAWEWLYLREESPTSSQLVRSTYSLIKGDC